MLQQQKTTETTTGGDKRKRVPEITEEDLKLNKGKISPSEYYRLKFKKPRSEIVTYEFFKKSADKTRSQLYKEMMGGDRERREVILSVRNSTI